MSETLDDVTRVKNKLDEIDDLIAQLKAKRRELLSIVKLSTVSEEENQVLALIDKGESPTIYRDKDRVNTLTRLRRRNIIANIGSRRNPKWVRI